MSEHLKVKRFYDAVRNSYEDLVDDSAALANTVLEAADYYVEVCDDANRHLLIVGRLEAMLAENTGLAYFYNAAHTDALQIRKHLEMLLDGYEAKKYVWFQTDPDAKAEFGKMTATDLRNYVKADDTVQLLNDCIRLIADRQHMLEDLRTGFVDRGARLRDITNVRMNGLEEVWVDGTKETANV